jgi:hypothetical protein
VQGRVVDPDGKPIAGAEVVHWEYLSPTASTDLNAFRVGTGNWPWIRNELDRTVTDREGRLTLSIVRSVPDLAVIIDLEGRPVAGATIRVCRIVHPIDHTEFERWLEAMAPAAPGPRPE